MPPDPLKEVRLRRTPDYLIGEHRSDFTLDPPLYTALHSIRTHVNGVLSTAKRYDTDGLSQMTKN